MTVLKFSDEWFAAGGWRVTARRTRRIFADLADEEFLKAMAWLINATRQRLPWGHR